MDHNFNLQFHHFRCRPYHRSLKKRLILQPKYYFYDTGLLSHLLEIETIDEIKDKDFTGLLFENFVISEIKKRYTNLGKYEKIYVFLEHGKRRRNRGKTL